MVTAVHGDKMQGAGLILASNFGKAALWTQGYHFQPFPFITQICFNFFFSSSSIPPKKLHTHNVILNK